MANNFFGLAKSSAIIAAFAGLMVAASDKSFCESENNDTSAADTSADNNNKIIIPTMPKSKLESIFEKIKLGPGSKLVKLAKQYQNGKSLIGLILVSAAKLVFFDSDVLFSLLASWKLPSLSKKRAER